tara:strand:- start:566 stop:763 length:198 start_codon:yes stop_codon:yes gene_type:complete
MICGQLPGFHYLEIVYRHATSTAIEKKRKKTLLLTTTPTLPLPLLLNMDEMGKEINRTNKPLKQK